MNTGFKVTVKNSLTAKEIQLFKSLFRKKNDEIGGAKVITTCHIKKTFTAIYLLFGFNFLVEPLNTSPTNSNLSRKDSQRWVQCDHIARLSVQYLAICNHENLPK